MKGKTKKNILCITLFLSLSLSLFPSSLFLAPISPDRPFPLSPGSPVHGPGDPPSRGDHGRVLPRRARPGHLVPDRDPKVAQVVFAAEDLEEAASGADGLDELVDLLGLLGLAAALGEDAV